MTNPDHVTAARAVYDHSAEQYVDAVGTTISPRFETVLDRALLDAFAEQTRNLGPGPVADIGCGSGRVAAYLSERGLDTAGFDISTGMVAAARAAHPHLSFQEGSLTDVPVPSHTLIAAVYWYSIIATPPAHLTAVWTELDRVLTADGHAMVAFQSGDGEAITQPDAYGSSTTLTLYHHSVDTVAQTLTNAGFDVTAKAVRQPTLRHETTPQAYLFVGRTTS